MVYSILDNETAQNFPLNTRKLLVILTITFLVIVGLAMFQDFLESKRSGYAFYFSESLLFKTIWFLYIPILVILYKRLKNEILKSIAKMTLFIVLPIVLHLLILPFIALFFSVLFYDGVYDLFKFLSYTVTHDLYTMVVIYTSFVLGYKYLIKQKQSVAISKRKPDTIIINNGRDNVIVNVKDIVQITSATPYVSIHLENKKYLYSETLKSVNEQLDQDIFIRVHKSTVVNVTKVCSFKSRLNGDYDLQLTNGTVIRLSRTYVSDFKRHFNKRHQVSL